MSSLHSIQRDFDRAARDYAKNASIQRRVAEDFVSSVSLSGAVCDIGCGTGFLSEMLQAPLMQCDLSYAMCQQAMTYGPTFQADMHQLPLAEDSLDSIISSTALQWVDNWNGFASSCQNVLKTGGTLQAAFFTHHSLEELQRVTAGDLPLVDMPSEGEVMDAFTDNGFSIEHSATETYEETHANILALLKSIKAIGGRAKGMRGYLSRKQLGQWEAYMPKDEDGRITLSWHVMFLTARKV